MGAMKTGSPNGYRRVGRFAAYGSAGTAIAIALLMAASPMAGALKPHTIVAPYKGTAANFSKSVYTYGNCKSTGALTGMHWLPKTGNETGFAYSSVKGCTVVPTGGGTADNGNQGTISVAFPVKVFTNTAHNFSVNWSYAYTVIASITGVPTCPAAKPVPGTYTYSYCSVDASTYVEFSMELYDQTNNSYLYGQHDYVQGPQNYTDVYNDSYCTSTGTCYSYNATYGCGYYKYYYQNCVPSGTMAAGSNTTWINSGNNCGYSYAGHCYYWHNWTLNSSHKFWILTALYFDAYAYVSGYGAGHGAIASVNGATLGNTGWKISSVTVT
ncbi:MAG TPA: hypothetical protein VFF67_02465 [Thermoplasmata archaeon]|nr:hypothetical protein [Thermoplasmata archaeon]